MFYYLATPNANTLVGDHTFEKTKSLKKNFDWYGEPKKHQKCCPLFLPQERGEIPCRCSSCEFWRVFRLSLFLATISSHSPIVLPPTCQPRQISTKKSFQPKSLKKHSPERRESLSWFKDTNQAHIWQKWKLSEKCL